MLQLEFKAAPFCDFQCIGNGVWIVTKGFEHFRFGFEIKLVRPELETVGVMDRLSSLDAEQDIMGMHVRLVQLVTVVCGHQRDGYLPAQFQQRLIDNLLLSNAVVLNF